jgi:hypothetical protein
MDKEGMARRGRAAKAKGYRTEHEMRKRHIIAGIPCKRVPLSGAVEGYKDDLILDVFDGLSVEVKARKTGKGFRQLETWQGEADVLIVKRDRQDPMVVVDWGVWLQLLSFVVDHDGEP